MPKKLPRDQNAKAFQIVQQAIAEPESQETNSDTVSQVMRQMGRKGGLKGGKARSEALTPERKKEIATKAAAARWKK